MHYQYHLIELEYELFLSYFRASVSAVAFALRVMLYDVNVPNTSPQLMLKQCMSREMFTVVIEILCLVKSHPDEALIFQLLDSFMLPEKFRLCVNLYG